MSPAAAHAGLVRRAASGDRAAAGKLIAPHLPALSRLCRRFAGPELADDCVQDTLLLALLRLPALRDPAAFEWWLRGIALRVCRRARARASAHASLPMDESDGAPPAADGEALDERLSVHDAARSVRAAVAELPAGQRRAVELYYLHDLSYDETAEALGIATGALKTRLHKARAALAHHYRLADGGGRRLDDRTLSVHEAGHAVLGWLEGDRVLRIAITPRAEVHLGFVSAEEPAGGVPAAARLAAIMAGEAAVARALPRRPRTDSGDRANAATIARAATGGDDVEAALAVTGALAAARARLEDTRTWALVERVAAALTERRVLDADEFRTLVTA